MARSDSQKNIFASGNEMPVEDFLDGTSARTRPLSYDDIMIRRKHKGDKAQQVSSISAADTGLAHKTEKESNIRESSPQISHNSRPVDENKNSNVSEKGRSGRKPNTNASRKNENLVKDNDERSLYHDAKSNSKDKRDRCVRRNRVSEEKIEGRNHGSRKEGDLLNIGGLDKRKDSESYKQDRVSKRSRVKSEIVKAQPHNQERQVYRKRKTDEQVGSDSDTKYKKRNVRQTYNSAARGKEKSVKEKKHKHDLEEGKSSGRNTFQMNELERKRSEPIRTYLEESRSKRRKSYKDREKERGRGSISQSPKAYKHTSKDKRELAELSSQSTKEKSGKEHSDVDNKRIPSNGSNSQYRRNANSSSGLGGYSPRKRKTDAAAKTPSPTHRSPERRTAGWDLQPIEKDSVQVTSIISNVNAASQKVSLKTIEYPSITPVAPVVVKPIETSLQTISSQMHAVESIQLTQATRPKRRLYVENLPVSASEKDLIECINKLLLLSGVNYIQGPGPCISCIIHKEKSQALLEFLTPEDVSAALLLDGMTYSGSNLSLRRPKDYADVTTGLPDKSVGGIESISDIVKDSPNKIFIGGISKLFSARMVLEIARAFGPVKAFHFEYIGDTNEPCAFVEYVDHSVTSKACAGLNGMRLGGQFLTAVLATPEHVSVVENVEELPTYGIPELAKSLIKKPTTILKLKNVFNPENLISLSGSELEGIMEDIRLECTRFGMVRFVNVANKTNPFGIMEVDEVRNTSACTDVYDFNFANRSHRVEQLRESTSGLTEFEKSEPLEAQKELEKKSCTLKERNGCEITAGLSDVLHRSVESEDINRSRLDGGSLSNEITACSTVKDEVCELPFNGEHVSLDEPSNQSSRVNFTEEFENQQSTSDVEMVGNCNNAGSDSVMKFELENKPSTAAYTSGDQNSNPLSSDELKIQEGNDSLNVDRKELDAAPGEGDKKNVFDDLGHIFEPGSVIIEYKRLEAACMAAHCLHGRTFDGRVVTVEYVAHELYQMRFRR